MLHSNINNLPLKRSQPLRNLIQAGFDPFQIALINNLKNKKNGLNLVSGPCGSGKSTTLEYILGIDSIDDEINMASLLKIAVDGAKKSSMWMSIKAASAMGIMKRFLRLKNGNYVTVEEELINSSSMISSLISQRLVKKICTHCAVPLVNQLEQIDKALIARLNQVFDKDLSGIKVKGFGCNHCKGQETVNRTVIAEIISCDTKFREKIFWAYPEAETYWLEKLNGMPMMAHGLLKVKRGEISPLDLEEEIGYIALPEKFNFKYFNSLY